MNTTEDEQPKPNMEQDGAVGGAVGGNQPDPPANPQPHVPQEHDADAHDAVVTDNVYVIDQQRNRVLGELGSQLALYEWFKQNGLDQFIPVNVPRGEMKEREWSKRSIAHEYFLAVQIMEWLAIYTQWSTYDATKPRMITRAWIEPKAYAHEQEKIVLHKHYSRAYKQLAQAALNVPNHTSLVRRLDRKLQRRLEAQHVKKLRHDGSVPLYQATSMLTDDDETHDGQRKPTDQGQKEEEPTNHDELLAQLQEQIAQMAIQRDEQEDLVKQLTSTGPFSAKKQSQKKKKTPLPFPELEETAASPRLPAPLHLTGARKKTKALAFVQQQHNTINDQLSHDSESDDGQGKIRRRTTRYHPHSGRRPPSPSPSPSHSEADSTSDSDSEDNRRRRQRRRQSARPRSRTPTQHLGYAHGSQIATLKNYDGKDGAQALIWLRDTETAARKFNWSDPVLVDAATGKLTNGAKRWYDQEINLFQDFRTWEKFSRALLAHYYPAGLSASAAAQMEKLKYEPTSQMQTLYDKIRELAYFTHEKLFAASIAKRTSAARQTAVQAAENTTFNAFKAKLPREMLLYVMSKSPSTSHEILQFALQYEEEMKHAKIVTEQKSYSAAISGKSNDITCHYCGKKGHIQPECRSRLRDAENGHYSPTANRGRGGRGGRYNGSSRGRGSHSQQQQGGYNQQQQNQQQQQQQSSYRGRGRGRGQRRGGTYAIGYDDPSSQHQDQQQYHQDDQNYDQSQQPQVSFPNDSTPPQENYYAGV